ncbi:hypothetical protein INS49_009589 [Diaporthe citri]|uniref:uncharacterized protein n=1 Tax=Diaporthe citri TaxID=83186 RepID=UPI001C7FF352|nr:uncharacterized protein INS49_009589 [Diaporthe citri]KAG6361362.1 hypothetical protein INS49_009589 [Diaporthe citri]
MLIEKILIILGAKLVAGSAVGTSPQVVDLDAELLRGNGCAAAGVVNGQCGRYYRATGCKDQIGAVGPGKCSRTCYKSSDGILSVRAVGDGTYGVNCHLFYDYNCQEKIGETGNAVLGGGKCYTPSQGTSGHSFLCWYKC